MGITKMSKVGFKSTSYLKSDSFLVGNAAFSPTAYESIQTITVGSGGSATVDFNSIPATYTHLQIRAMIGTSSAGGNLSLTFNNNTTGTKYAYHYMASNGGASIFTGESINRNIINLSDFVGGALNSSPTPFIIDILDYANTNKYKTLRNLSGYDVNGAGGIGFFTGHWRDTSAINQIIFYPSAATIVENSSFALYGIKGA